MGDSTGRAVSRDFRLLFLPVAIGLLIALAFAVQSARADHGETHVQLVSTANPSQDLGLTPLVLQAGDTADIDLLIQLPSAADDVYGGEFHFSLEPRGVVRIVDTQVDSPSINLATDGQGLALTNLERLRLTVDGFPDNGDAVRGCVYDAIPDSGDDADYIFIKGIDDDSGVGLAELAQESAGACGPTAAGISLSWFAETNPADFGALVPDRNNDGLDDADRYAAVGALGTMMGTDGVNGTTDDGFVEGIASYIESVGLAGDFSIKVFNHPFLIEYMRELQDGEDVLVGLTYADGSGHWLVGRSFGAIDEKGNDDPADDTWPISFVDPGSGNLYHSTFRRGREFWYNDEWVSFDIMVSVSPTDAAPNGDTAQYFLAKNEVFTERNLPNLQGDFTFVLLRDTPALQGDVNSGRVIVARITVEALAQGTTSISFVSPGQGMAPVLIVGSADIGCVVCPPPPAFTTPAAVIQVEDVGANLAATVALRGNRSDPEGWVGGFVDGDQLNPVPITVRFFTPGGSVTVDAPVATYVCDPMDKVVGQPFGTCNILGVIEGTWDITTVGPHTLPNVARNVVIAAGENQIDMGTLFEGDSDENGDVNLLDVGLLIGSYSTSCGDDAYRASTDLDNNCSVNLLDVGLMIGGYNVVAPVELD